MTLQWPWNTIKVALKVVWMGKAWWVCTITQSLTFITFIISEKTATLKFLPHTNTDHYTYSHFFMRVKKEHILLQNLHVFETIHAKKLRQQYIFFGREQVNEQQMKNLALTKPTYLQHSTSQVLIQTYNFSSFLSFSSSSSTSTSSLSSSSQWIVMGRTLKINDLYHTS